MKQTICDRCEKADFISQRKSLRNLLYLLGIIIIPIGVTLAEYWNKWWQILIYYAIIYIGVLCFSKAEKIYDEICILRRK